MSSFVAAACAEKNLKSWTPSTACEASAAVINELEVFFNIKALSRSRSALVINIELLCIGDRLRVIVSAGDEAVSSLSKPLSGRLSYMLKQQLLAGQTPVAGLASFIMANSSEGLYEESQLSLHYEKGVLQYVGGTVITQCGRKPYHIPLYHRGFINAFAKQENWDLIYDIAIKKEYCFASIFGSESREELSEENAFDWLSAVNADSLRYATRVSKPGSEFARDIACLKSGIDTAQLVKQKTIPTCFNLYQVVSNSPKNFLWHELDELNMSDTRVVYYTGGTSIYHPVPSSCLVLETNDKTLVLDYTGMPCIFSPCA